MCGAPRPGAARRPRAHCPAPLPTCAERRPQGNGWPALFCGALRVGCTRAERSMEWCPWLGTWGGALDSARAPTPAQCTSRQHGLPDRRRRSEVVFVIIHHVSTTVRLYVVHDGRIHTQTKIHSQRAASDWKSTRLRTAPPMRPQWPPPNHDPSEKCSGFVEARSPPCRAIRTGREFSFVLAVA